MDTNQLTATVNEMLRVGLLAADESQGTAEAPKTIGKRLIAAGIPATPSNVDAWRKLVRDTPDLEKYISAVILEKSRVGSDGPIYAAKGIVPGVKVDGGTSKKVGPKDEKLTDGLDGLDGRLAEYKGQGARFAKWRTVTPIGDGLPTQEGINANMDTQVKYALACQNLDIVPVCEPEVLIDGGHSIERSHGVTRQVLRTLFSQAVKEGVYLPGFILKTSMVIYGKEYSGERGIEEVAKKTISCLKESVPEDVAGVVFLSGGQTDRQAALHLNAIKKMIYEGGAIVRWSVSFSYSRAIQHDAMQIWQGNSKYVQFAQEALLERARACALASRGALNPNFDYQIKAPKAI